MMWLWDMVGYGIIISSVIAFLFVGSPFFSLLNFISPPAAQGVKWYATNIGNAIPVAIFVILSKANPKGLAVAALVAAISWVVANFLILPNLGVA